MLFRTIYDDSLAQAAYLIGCQKTGEALVIDPERDVERYIDAAAREGLRITHIAETHIHADFLSGARELAERTGARLHLSAEGGPDWNYRWLDSKVGGGSYKRQILSDGDTFAVGAIRIQALHTPGHTPEHMSYLVTDLGGGADEPMGIVTGDFVFVGDVGRPDLLESAAGMEGAADPAARKLYTSLRIFDALPEHLQVWPGHGAGSACGKALGAVPQSTVGYEKRFNTPLVAARGEEAIFVESIIEGQPEPPPYFARMKAENREGPAVLGGMPRPKKTLPPSIDVNDRNVVVIDTRPWDAFRAGHLARSLHVPLGRTITTIAGSYIDPGMTIYLIVDDDRVADVVAPLIRIGLDTIKGYVTPDEVTAYGNAGGELSTITEIDMTRFAETIRTSRPTILDVRNSSEFREGHVAGATNVAHTRLAPSVDRIPEADPLYVHCKSGARSAAAAAWLQRMGRTVVSARGDFSTLTTLLDPAFIETSSTEVVTG